MSETTEQEAVVQALMQQQFTTGGLRSVFNEFDVTDTGSNAYEFPIPVDNDPTEPVREGEHMPRTGMEYESKTVHFDKFGFEVNHETSRSDIEDTVDIMFAQITQQAADNVYDAVDVSWEMTANRLDIVERALVSSGTTVPYDEQDTVVVSEVLGESIAQSDPTRDWDEIQADFADEYGIRVVTDQYNTLRGSDVLVVDSDVFGYETVKAYPETRSYVEYEKHDPARQIEIPEEEREIRQEVTQGFVRLAYAVMDDDAAHVVRFPSV
jgi:hypothetical protein